MVVSGPDGGRRLGQHLKGKMVLGQGQCGRDGTGEKEWVKVYFEGRTDRIFLYSTCGTSENVSSQLFLSLSSYFRFTSSKFLFLTFIKQRSELNVVYLLVFPEKASCLNFKCFF